MGLRAVVLAIAAWVCGAATSWAACEEPVGVCDVAVEGGSALISAGTPAAIWFDIENDHAGVRLAVEDLQADLAALAGTERPTGYGAAPPRRGPVIIVGTLGRSAPIDRLVREGKLDVSGLAGQWEGFVQQVVDRPAPGIRRALVIAGSDKRGTIFGVYDLSERMGVSPWAWWADVPIAQRINLYAAPGRRADHPVVRYRGIFINDENPALYGWAHETFGGFNARFYERVFELILRLKGNYLWPAMWGKSIYDDDPASPELANDMGVVLGTSHHEPLTRAHVEWERYGEGPWDYTRNEERLKAFWRAAMTRMGDNESVVTIGMRGDGDEAMTQGTATALLEHIVADQRQIIAETTGKPASETPQIWALYKEVQAYYEQGMRVPDDVTLLFADDNWGNIRRLPDLGAAPRAGGYGVYYHFDYVGGPRNYKWLNTNQIERVWEQMKLARDYGADRIWIVNVGDIKPMEFPISFFLDLAWDPDACDLTCLEAYPRDWAERTFGEEHAEEIGALLTRYAQLAARRKPELVNPDTYSLVNFNEAERVLREWTALRARADLLRTRMPETALAAYFQLVLHPILANSNLQELYITAARNRLYAAQGRSSTNVYADGVEALFRNDADIARRYHTLLDGKWNHMMSQTHIGYTSWQQPDADVAPEIRRLTFPSAAGLGVAIEGTSDAWPGARAPAALPALTPFTSPSRVIEVFNRGQTPLMFSARSAAPWLRLSETSGEVSDGAARIEVSVDWAQAPAGDHRVPITIEGAGGSVRVVAHVINPENAAAARGFVEADNVVAIEAAHFARAVGGQDVAWREIPHLSRSLSGMAVFPRTHEPFTPGGASPRLEYDMHLFSSGRVNIDAVFSPTMNFTGRGLRYAVSIDDEAPQIVNVHQRADGRLMHSGESDQVWETWVANNANVQTTTHAVAASGAHVVKIWEVDPGLVLQRVLVRTGEVAPSYLGPPESARR